MFAEVTGSLDMMLYIQENGEHKIGKVFADVENVISGITSNINSSSKLRK